MGRLCVLGAESEACAFPDFISAVLRLSKREVNREGEKVGGLSLAISPSQYKRFKGIIS
jgi:hypothetical protein